MRKYLFKIICTITAVFVLGLSFAGCNGEVETEPTSETTKTSDSETTPQEVELNVITWRVEDKQYFDWAHEKFEDEYPHITINFDASPTDQWDQLRTSRMASGNVDVLASDFWDLNNIHMNENFLNLEGQSYLENYYQDVLEMSQFEGKQLQLPSNMTSTVTFYNKDLFDELEISIPKTWSEFVSVCETIQESGTAPLLFGGADQWPVYMIIMGIEPGIVRGANPDFYGEGSINMREGTTKFTDPEWVEVYEKFEVLSNYFLENTVGLGYGQAPGRFAMGDAAMMIDGSWSQAQIMDANPDFEVGVFIAPGSDNPEHNESLPVKIGGGWSIYNQSDNIDAAHKYLEFTSRKDIYEKYIEIVQMGPVIDGIELEDPLSQEMANLSVNTTPQWDQFSIPGAKYDYAEYLIGIILGEYTPQEAAEKMQQDFVDSKEDWQ